MGGGLSPIQHLFNATIANEVKGVYCRKIEPAKIDILKKSKRVIVYGAGAVARDVLKILDQNQIGVYAFAVSKKDGNPDYIMGLPVRVLDELLEFRYESVVFVAVTPKLQKEIIESLRTCGFETIIPAM